MHAFLIIGNDEKVIRQSIKKIVGSDNTTVVNFELSKINEVRSLQQFVKLKAAKPTTIVIPDIDNATAEAVNAFLKNLEEPQKNIRYILTASVQNKVLPTIISRCHVIRTKNTNTTSSKISQDFLTLSIGEKFMFLEKLTKREEATAFVQDFITVCHDKILSSPDKNTYSKYIRIAHKTKNALEANGNIKLQLANFAIKL